MRNFGVNGPVLESVYDWQHFNIQSLWLGLCVHVPLTIITGKRVQMLCSQEYNSGFRIILDSTLSMQPLITSLVKMFFYISSASSLVPKTDQANHTALLPSQVAYHRLDHLQNLTFFALNVSITVLLITSLPASLSRLHPDHIIQQLIDLTPLCIHWSHFWNTFPT